MLPMLPVYVVTDVATLRVGPPRATVAVDDAWPVATPCHNEGQKLIATPPPPADSGIAITHIFALDHHSYRTS